jgi:hypothetical protein
MTITNTNQRENTGRKYRMREIRIQREKDTACTGCMPDVFTAGK